MYKRQANSNADIIITEIGGTVGDIESLPFLEAIREFKMMSIGTMLHTYT